MKYYVYSIHSNPCNNEKGKSLTEWLREKLESAMIEGDFLDDLLSCIKSKVYSLNSEHGRTKPWGVSMRHNSGLGARKLCWITAGPIHSNGTRNEDTIIISFVEIAREIRLNDLARF